MPDAHQVADQGPAEAGEAATLSEDLHRLIDQGKALGQAELAWQKARAAYAGRQAGGIALLALSVAALMFLALMALVLGAVIALAPALGAWGATAAVAGTLLVLALFAGLIAMLKAHSTARLVADPRDAR